MDDNKYLGLPNADYSILQHPSGLDESLEVALVKDHRFVFYFWFKWWKEINEPYPLITIDWHKDLCAPSDIEKEDLKNLNLNSYKDVAFFSWDKLNRLNDGHILAASYLNIIGDIYVLCKQDNISKESFKDYQGNEHKVVCFHSIEKLYEEVLEKNFSNLYFDIDLDYFTESEDICGGGENLKLMSDNDILSILNPNSNFIKWIFERIRGMTIATEPKFCGGLRNSNYLYSLLDDTFFKPQLFSKKCRWKHLQTNN
jgi:hypothetical protein